jgi:hypothetical protein
MIRLVYTFTLALVLLTASIGLAQAACDALPKVSWWGTNTHQKIVNYVNKKYAGDWESYITKWNNYSSRIQKIIDNDGAAVIKSKNLRLEGQELVAYLENMNQRISVVQCLAKEAGTGTGSGSGEEIKYTCPKIPEVEWWGDITHESMVAYVEKRLSGNWRPYIAKLDEEMNNMIRSFSEGEEVQLNNLGFVLGNEELGLYISQLAQLLAIGHCLANDATSR